MPSQSAKYNCASLHSQSRLRRHTKVACHIRLLSRSVRRFDCRRRRSAVSSYAQFISPNAGSRRQPNAGRRRLPNAGCRRLPSAEDISLSPTPSFVGALQFGLTSDDRVNRIQVDEVGLIPPAGDTEEGDEHEVCTSYSQGMLEFTEKTRTRRGAPTSCILAGCVLVIGPVVLARPSGKRSCVMRNVAQFWKDNSGMPFVQHWRKQLQGGCVVLCVDGGCLFFCRAYCCTVLQPIPCVWSREWARLIQASKRHCREGGVVDEVAMIRNADLRELRCWLVWENCVFRIEETRCFLTDRNKRQPELSDPIPREVVRHVLAVPFAPDEDHICKNMRIAQRCAAGGPSGVTADHLRPLMDGPRSEIVLQVGREVGTN